MATIGEILRTEREERGESTSQAASATRIKIQHIEAMEQDDFSGIPAAAYAKGFIKLYAEHLDLDPRPLIRQYLEQHAPVERPPLSADMPRSEGRRAASPAETVPSPRGSSRGRTRQTILGACVMLVVVAGVTALIRWGRLRLGDTIGLSARRDSAVSGILQEPPEPYLETPGLAKGRSP